MFGSRSRIVLLSIAFTVGTAAAPVAADDALLVEGATALGTRIRLSGPAATGWESAPDVAGNPASGRFLTVWADRRDMVNHQIYGQLVDGSGARVGWNFKITGKAADEGADNPAVVWNPVAGQYLVVWSDDRNHLSRGRDIFGQRLAADGSRIGSNFRISGAGATDDETGPAVAVDPGSGRYLVVWSDDRNKGTRAADVYGQVLGSAGAKIGNNVRIVGKNATGEDYWPAVAADPGGAGFLVVWDDNRPPVGGVFAQQLDIGGNRLGPNHRVSSADAGWSGPDLASGPAGTGFLVVWPDFRDDPPMLSNVYGQRVRTDGTRRGSNFLISGINGSREDETPTVSWDGGANRWLVAWWEHEIFACDGCEPPPGGEARVLGRWVGPAGKRIGGRFAIFTASLQYPHMEPTAAWNPTAGAHFVAWTDEPKHATRGSDVFGRTVAP